MICALFVATPATRASERLPAPPAQLVSGAGGRAVVLFERGRAAAVAAGGSAGRSGCRCP